MDWLTPVRAGMSALADADVVSNIRSSACGAKNCCLILGCSLAAMASAQGWIQPFPVGPVTTRRPSVGAYLAPEFASGSLLCTIDGQPIKGAVSQDSTRWSWTPNYDLDPGRHIAILQSRSAAGQSLNRSWVFVVSDGTPASASDLDVLETRPAPNEGSLQPSRISAQFSAPLRAARLTLDGQQVTPQVSQGLVQYQPSRPLTRGNHRVAIVAVGLDGSVREKSWTFQSLPGSTPPPTNSPISVRSPRPGQFTDGQPLIRVQFQEAVLEPRLVVDNHDLSTAARTANGELAWQPNYAIDPGPHEIEVSARRPEGGAIIEKWSFYTLRPGEAQAEKINRIVPADGTLRQTPEVEVQPAAGSHTGPRPAIEFHLPAAKKYLRFVMVIDGSNLTDQAVARGSRLQWIPSYDLAPIEHSVSVIAQATDNSYYYRNWTFQVP